MFLRWGFRRCRSQYSLPIMPLCTIPAFFDVSTNILTGAMPAELGDLPELRELHMNQGFSLSRASSSSHIFCFCFCLGCLSLRARFGRVFSF